MKHFLIHRAMQIAGTSTVLVLGVFLFRMYRHERRRLVDEPAKQPDTQHSPLTTNPS